MAVKRDTAVYDIVINGEVANKTLKDLNTALREVRAQFSLTTDPAEKGKLAASYQKIASHAKEMNDQLKGTPSFLDRIKNGAFEVAAGLGLAFGVERIIQFGEGALHAFAELEKNTRLLKTQITSVNGETAESFEGLQQQSEKLSGFFSQSEILKTQLYFAQFGLGSKEIAKTIPIVSDFAAATGQSIPDAAEKLGRAIEGQGRGLKKYGINVEDTGSKTKNLEQILAALERRFSGQTKLIEQATSSGAFAKLSSSWEKLKESVGGFIAPAVAGLATFITKIIDTKDQSEKLTDEWRAQKKATDDLQTNISPLLVRYDQLKTKTNLTTKEQDELKKIIDKVGEALPEAITQFDKYGKAMNISTDAARNLIDAQRKLTAFKNADAIKTTESNITDLQKRIEAYVKQLNAGTEIVITNLRDGSTETKKLSESGIKNIQSQIDDANKKLSGLKLLLKELKGEPLVEGNSTDKKTLGDETSAAKEKQEKLLAEQKKFDERMIQLQQEFERSVANAVADEAHRELALKEQDYQKKITDEKRKNQEFQKSDLLTAAQKAESQKRTDDLLIKMEDEHQREMADIRKKYTDKRLKESLDEDLKALHKIAAAEDKALADQLAKNEIIQEQYDERKLANDLAEMQSEKIILQQHGQDTTEIEKKIAAQLIAIHKNVFKEEEKDLNASIDVRKKIAQHELNAAKEGSHAQLQLRIDALNDARVVEIDNAEGNAELIEAINKDYNSKIANAKKQFWTTIIGYAEEAMSQIASIMQSNAARQNNIEQKRLNQLKVGYDKDRAYWDAALKHKEISQATHDNKIKQIDEKQAKAERKAQHDAAIRNQKAAIFDAELSAGKAIAGTLSQHPIGIWNIALAAIMAVAAEQEIEAIKSEEIPELGKGKQFKNIGKHPHSKQKLIDPDGMAYSVEEGEVLLSAKTAEKNPIVYDLLNASLTNDGEIPEGATDTRVVTSLPYLSAEQPQVNFSRVVETTHYVNSTFSDSRAANPNQHTARVVTSSPAQRRGADQEASFEMLMEHYAEMKKTMDKLNNHLDKGIHAQLTYRQFMKDKKRLDAISGGNP